MRIKAHKCHPIRTQTNTDTAPTVLPTIRHHNAHTEQHRKGQPPKEKTSKVWLLQNYFLSVFPLQLFVCKSVKMEASVSDRTLVSVLRAGKVCTVKHRSVNGRV
ncbi:hypothetical protein XENOCAPTIV_021835 [Xenoophorus captivus]|uniref:Uncharacterized protein n=1 Tax=Xenoophorus captivus TaxID=1517983 RepID=A0ABV0REE5_9TELE